jgi:hypothetical protein
MHTLMKPTAFVYTTAGVFRIYDQGDDWQIIGPSNFERWRSKWSEDIAGSLEEAAKACPGADAKTYTQQEGLNHALFRHLHQAQHPPSAGFSIQRHRPGRL